MKWQSRPKGGDAKPRVYVFSRWTAGGK